MLNIRRATPADAPGIAAVAIATWVDTYAVDGVNAIYAEYSLDRFTPRNIECLIERKDLFVAETDFGLVGYGLASASGIGRWELETLYVLPKWQGAGVGKKLLDTIVSHCSGPLWLKCAHDNDNALTFYRRRGFIETAETWFELAGEKYRCLIFESPPADRSGGPPPPVANNSR